MSSTKPTNQKRPPEQNGMVRWIIVGSVVAVLAIVAIVAVAASGGSGTADEPPGSSQTRPVEVVGAKLADFNGTPDAAIGSVAPSIVGSTFDGTPISFEAGAPTVLMFVAHWCPHCQREVPAVVEWAASGGVPDGVDVVGVASTTSPERPNYPPEAWLRRENFDFPVIADSAASEAAIAFGATSYPYFVVVDADGNVVTRMSGNFDPVAMTELLTSIAV